MTDLTTRCLPGLRAILGDYRSPKDLEAIVRVVVGEMKADPAAIEKVAEAICIATREYYWPDMEEDRREAFREEARAAIRAFFDAALSPEEAASPVAEEYIGYFMQGRKGPT